MNVSRILLYCQTLVLGCCTNSLFAQVPITPPMKELTASFGQHDERAFASPAKVYYPETWFHLISGNVSKEGITADLEAISSAGFS